MNQRFFVTGRVQGVGFRQFTLTRARQIGVSGFVRNLPDGSVECVAAGTEEQLAALEAALRRGPPGAEVTSVTREPVQSVPGPGFGVR